MSVTLQTFASRMNRLDFGTAVKIAMRKLKAREEWIKLGNKAPISKREERELCGDFGIPCPAHFYSNTQWFMGPIALTNTLTTNLFNPGTTTGGVNCTSAPFDKLYVLATYVTVTNKTGGGVTVSLWIGATGGNVAGTEWLFQAYSVPANSFVDRYPRKRFGQADFLVGGAGAATSLSFYMAGEIGIGA